MNSLLPDVRAAGWPMKLTAASFGLTSSLLPILLLLSGSALRAGAQTSQSGLLVDERFESDLTAWSRVNAERIEIVADPAAPDNHVIQLTPEKGEYTTRSTKHPGTGAIFASRAVFSFRPKGTGTSA